MNKTTMWSEWEKGVLAKIYSRMMNRHIGKIIKRSERAISAQAFKMRLRKTEKFMKYYESFGRFKKGSVPVNKGRKMSKAVYERAKATMFKKGNLPHNTLYDGAESIRTDRHGRKSIFVRVSKGIWEPKQKVEWEKKYGPIPKGKILYCKTKNTMDTSPDNWELVTRVVSIKRSQMSDSSVALRLSGRNPEIKKYIMQNRRDLIDLKRQTEILKKKINGSTGKTEEYGE